MSRQSGLSKFGQQHGVDIVHDFFTPETAPAADAIVIDNVLEHVIDPQRLLADAVATLRPGGLDVVIVPNRDDLRQLVPSWRDARHWIPPDHINYFSMSDVKRMFANCQLDAQAVWILCTDHARLSLFSARRAGNHENLAARA